MAILLHNVGTSAVRCVSSSRGPEGQVYLFKCIQKGRSQMHARATLLVMSGNLPKLGLLIRN
jgi:hypothetical protein